MAISDEYRPRFSFDMTEEQRKRADRLIATHGMRKALMSVILDDLLDLLEERGQMVAGVIMNRLLKPREVIPIMGEAERKSRGETR